MNPAADIKSAPQRAAPICYVELLGAVRLHTGLKHLTVDVGAPTPMPAFLDALARVCPSLVGPVLDLDGGGLVVGHILNRNGREFLRGEDVIQPGDRLLLMSSSAGG